MPNTAEIDITDIVKPHYERGLEQGLEQGIEQGIEQGAYQRAIEAARKMLVANEPLEKVTLYTGLSLEELKQQGLVKR